MKNSEKTSRAHRALAFLYALVGALLIIVFSTIDDKEIEPVGLLLFIVLFGGLFALHYAIAKAAREDGTTAQKWAGGI